MKDRIKEIRSKKNLTQQEFANRLSLKRNTIATYEIGKAMPSDRTVQDICEKFGVNEEWLRTGKGEMLIPLSRDEEIARFIGEMIKEDDTFKKKLISVLARLDEKDWEDLERIAKNFIKKD